MGGGESWLQYEHVKSNLSPPTPPRVSLGPRGPLGPMIHHSGGMRACFGNSHYLGVFAEISRSIGYLAQIMACGAKMSPKMWATAENLTSNLKKPGEMSKYCKLSKMGPISPELCIMGPRGGLGASEARDLVWSPRFGLDASL